MVTKLSSRWPTRVLEFRNLTWSASSSDSIEWTRPGRVRPEERGWAFRSRGILWMRMADAFGWKAPLGRVRGSASALTPRRNIGWLQVAHSLCPVVIANVKITQGNLCYLDKDLRKIFTSPSCFLYIDELG